MDWSHIACELPSKTRYSRKKIEGMIEVMGRRRKRSKQLVDTVKERKGYWKLKREALDRTLWRTRFGRSYGLS